MRALGGPSWSDETSKASRTTRKQQLPILRKDLASIVDGWLEGNAGFEKKLTDDCIRPPSDESRLPSDEPSESDALLQHDGGETAAMTWKDVQLT
jgi:hypothetical protein